MTNNSRKPYPFSDHDNKRTLENHGEHFDRNLGRKIKSSESTEHYTPLSFLSWDHATTMKSLQTDSYVKLTCKKSELTRYPDHYSSADRKNKGPSISECSHKLSFPIQERHKTSLSVIAETQHRDKNAHLWNYSY
ncbi:hypothetical protein LOD99_13642 [Oopsacas minuta]|uniref:Domain of unknown function with conserved HDNR motif domain-containing protein n=1 Tax=Oopsacas minuta TaxID=111878 RepID=A0AAV7KI80_9METZ|nr:hypothetical protein LOD99_13642 [Oopsacas minuta]